jgi:5-methylcytosine-specific restriction protein A
MPKPIERRQRNRESDARRRQTKPWRAWYNTARWQALRDAQLRRQPLCERCSTPARPVGATTVHHKHRHEGDAAKFWNGELASSCKACHDALEQRIEALGYEIGCDAKGRPVAADHPWNRTG